MLEPTEIDGSKQGRAELVQTASLVDGEINEECCQGDPVALPARIGFAFGTEREKDGRECILKCSPPIAERELAAELKHR